MHGTDDRTAVAARSSSVWKERERWVARGVATYSHVVADRAHGAELWDVDGRRYIDFAGGIGTLNVGHTPQPVVEAIRDQAETLIHSCFSVAIYEPYVELARRLSGLAPGDFAKKGMLVNSGAEAVENAVKIARAATGRPTVIAFHNAFHGRTLMGMSLTGKQRPYKEGFGPFAPGVYHAAFPYAYRCPVPSCAHNGGGDACPIESGAELERLLSGEVPAQQVAAIVVEPVQGEGGFVVAPAPFLRRLREICDRTGILLVADEVQTGIGRTARMFAVEHAGVAPDLIVLAKSLGAGLPIGAVVGRAEVMDAPQPGGIGTTFGGNPLACRAALAALDIIERDHLLDRAGYIGGVVLERFREMQTRYPLIGEVRGLGAMVAMELVRDRESKEPAAAETASILHRCHDAGLLVIKAGLYDNVLRVLVPLVVGDDQLREGLDILERALADVERERPGDDRTPPGEGA
ncbi:MAG: 4-aminobutyrate--2-oxoglutarate transaminase [Chloroflexi bacterium]|nr:4-aminobutyrate--2-oxoglutarate transaminase [Chloroflexota bacterium]